MITTKIINTHHIIISNISIDTCIYIYIYRERERERDTYMFVSDATISLYARRSQGARGRPREAGGAPGATTTTNDNHHTNNKFNNTNDTY